jgi:predicted dehydrogenase
MKKIAVAGFGFMGKTHTLNILKNKDLKLSAIVDINPDLAGKDLFAGTGNFSTGNISADDLSDIHTYTSLDDCMETEDLDAVVISVHTNLHYEMAKKALLLGKHVFIEKPFCLDIGQAEELINLAGQKERILMVGHVVRFMPPYEKLRQWIVSRQFGELKFLSFTRFSGIPGWGQWKDSKVTGTSGGALFDLVIHDIDFAGYLLGTPSDIKCTCLPGGLSEHDYISALWNYRDTGVSVRIEGGNIFHTSFPFQAGYIARFENASVQYHTFKGDVIQIADEGGMEEVAAGDAGEGFFNEIDYFAQCMKSGTPPYRCMPASALESIKLCYSHINKPEL